MTLLQRMYRASNPMLAAQTAGLFMLGVAAGYYSGLAREINFVSLALYFLWFALFESMFTVLLNNYYDREEDARNPRKAQYEAVYDDSLFWPYWAAMGVAVAAFFVLYAVYPEEKVLVYVLILFVANWVYDAPPLRVKERPGLDVLVGACTQVMPPVFGAYALVTGQWPALFVLAAAVCALCNFELFHKTFDIETDRGMGLHTAAVWLGLKKSLVLCALLQGAAVGLLAWGSGQPWWVLLALPYLLMTYCLWQKPAEEERRARYGPMRWAYFIVGVVMTAFLFIAA